MTTDERTRCHESSLAVGKVVNELRDLERRYDLAYDTDFKQAVSAADRLCYLLEVLSCRVQKTETPA